MERLARAAIARALRDTQQQKNMMLHHDAVRWFTSGAWEPYCAVAYEYMRSVVMCPECGFVHATEHGDGGVIYRLCDGCNRSPGCQLYDSDSTTPPLW